MRSAAIVLCLAAAMGVGASGAVAQGGQPDLEEQVLELQLTLDAQEEARDRQADAFSAAASRMEFVNAVLVGLITLAALAGALLAIRWVRQLAHRIIEAQIETEVDRKGTEIFESVSTELRAEYDEKFAELYRRFNRLVDKDESR